MAERETVVLQGHVDMVCQQDGDAHDFSATRFSPGWPTMAGCARGPAWALTTALAWPPCWRCWKAMTSPIRRWRRCSPSTKKPAWTALAIWRKTCSPAASLLNLDTEDWGEFYIGCAGGEDVILRRQCRREPLPPEHHAWRLTVRGLCGWSFRVDIHRYRANATRLLARLLSELAGRFGLRVGQLAGGALRNVIRAKPATLAVPESKLEALQHTLLDWQKRVAATLPEWDHGLTVTLGPAQLNAVLSLHDQAVLIDPLNALPDGMAGLSPSCPMWCTPRPIWAWSAWTMAAFRRCRWCVR